jgi:hypothetical protein
MLVKSNTEHNYIQSNLDIKEVFVSTVHRRLVDKFYSLKSLTFKGTFFSTRPLLYFNIIGSKIKKRTVLGTKFFY